MRCPASMVDTRSQYETHFQNRRCFNRISSGILDNSASSLVISVGGPPLRHQQFLFGVCAMCRMRIIARAGRALSLHRDTLGEVAGLVGVMAAQQRQVVPE